MQQHQGLSKGIEKAREFESRFSFRHDLPSPLPRVVTAFVYNSWPAGMKKKKRPAPPPPGPQTLKDVQNAVFNNNNAYDIISIQTHTFKEIAPHAPRLISFCDPKTAKENAAGRKGNAGKEHVSNPDKNVSKTSSRGTKGTPKKDSLKARKNKSHVSVIRRNLEGEAKTESKSRKEVKEKKVKIPRDPTYEEIKDFLDDNQNIKELSALLGDYALRKSVAIDVSNIRTPQMTSVRNRKSASGVREKKGGDVATAKENVRDGASSVKKTSPGSSVATTPERRDQNITSHQSREIDANSSKGSLKTYMFGENLKGKQTKKDNPLKERQCHVTWPRPLERQSKTKENDIAVNDFGDKRQKPVSSPFLKTSSRATARKNKDIVVHTYKRRTQKTDRHRDSLSGSARHFVHQIPRITIINESIMRNGKAKSRSLGKLRSSKMMDISAIDSEHPRETYRSGDDFVDLRKPRAHSSREYESPQYGSLERSRTKRGTPRRESPSLSDDLYVRRKSRGTRDDLAKMR